MPKLGDSQPYFAKTKLKEMELLQLGIYQQQFLN